MGNVTLVRPDGTLINVDENEAGKLRTLGYKDETLEQQAGRMEAQGTQEFYQSPGQKLKTGAEGLLGGATLGLSDLAFDKMGFDTAERAGYNPGIRMGTELLGGLAGLAPLGEFTPVGLLGKGAKSAAEVMAESKTARAVTAAAIEGGGFGAGSALTSAVVSGDPLTAESVMAGVGWGAVWGGGLGGLVGGATARLEAKAAEKAAMEEAQAASLRETNQAWGNFRASVSDAANELKATTKMADAALESSKSSVASAIKDATEAKNGWLNERLATANSVGMGPGAEAIGGSAFQSSVRGASKAYGEARAAARAGDFDKLQESLANFKGHTDTIAQLHGIQAPEIAPFAADAAKNAAKSAEVLAKMGAVEKHLNSLAVSPEEFAKMGPGKADRVFAAVDGLMSTQAPELKGVQEALKAGIEQFEQALGVVTDGTPATKLRGVWEGMRHNLSKAGVEDATKAAGGILPWGKRLVGAEVGRRASKAVREAGWGSIAQTMAYEGGKNIAMGLLGIKAAVLGGVSKAAEAWLPKALKAASVAAPRVEPLATRLDGTVDKGNKTRMQLMEERANEIRQAAGSVKDTLYKSVSPLADYHPEFAAALHDLGVKQFQFLFDKLPRDPGLAFDRLKSLYKADPVTMEKFARYYEVFQDPAGVMRRTLMTGSITPEAAEGLREMQPAMFAQLRVTMLERLSNPKIMNALSYNEQVGLGNLLQIPIHSTMTPQFVAAQQQMFQARQQLSPIAPQPGATGSAGGRPSGPANNPEATSSQKITEH